MAARNLLAGVPPARLVGGFFIQPVAAALLGYLLFPLFVAASGGGTYVGGPSNPALAVGLAAAVVAVPTTVIAVLLVIWRATRGTISFAETIAWGGVLGAGPLLALFVLTGQATAHVFIRTMLAGSVFGFIGAGLFWLIAIRGTSLDSDRNPNPLRAGNS